MSGFWSSSSTAACVSVGISLYGVIAYLAGILDGGTRPRMASWVAWCTANTVFTAVAYLAGAYLAAGINAASATMNAAVIALGLRRGVSLRPGDNIDWACLLSSIACVLVTVEISDKTFGAMLAICANLIATVPTLRHAWSKPQEETWQMFAANAFAGALGVSGVLLASGYQFATVAGPLITTIGNIVLVTLTVGRGRFAEDAVVPVRVG
ncbi:hypothetical protein ACWEO2_16080 [Nocardia sp. NPDC004278]